MLPLAAGLLLFAPIALIGNVVGSALRYPDVGAAVLFPPYAALTAALVVFPRRQWIWFILICSLAHFVAHWPEWSLSWVFFADVANIARALTAAALLRWLLGSPLRLHSVPALSLFALAGVFAGPAVGAVLGAANVVMHSAGSQSYWEAWSAWFVSNALTGLIMLPGCCIVFACAARAQRVHIDRQRLIEAGLLVFALLAPCVVAIIRGPDLRYLALPLYASLPVVMWAALRFGAGGASLALTAVVCTAIWNVDRGLSPFLAVTTDDNVIALQTFALLTGAPVLCLAALGSAHRDVMQLHHSLLASLQDHVAILNASGVVLEVNQSWKDHARRADLPLFHRVRAGDHYVATCRFGAELGDAIAAAVLGGVTSVLDRTRLRYEIDYDQDSHGRPESYTMSVEALEREDGGAVITRSNTTARRQAQAQIEEQRSQLSHLARVAVLGQLSGAIAHELNQPLTAILSNAEAARQLIRRKTADPEQLAEIMGDIVADDQRAAAVIQRLRALLKRGERQLQTIEGADLVNEVLALARTELIARQVTASAVVEPSLPVFLGDRIQLQQVLLNLILNACEAMGTTAIADRRLVLTANGDAAGNAHFAIRDHGTGIPADLIDRLFEPFVTTKADGLGLGLSISRTIVAAHGGRLWAENNADGGATMHCILPVTATSRRDQPLLSPPVHAA